MAQIWHDGWQDAHARILPAELARIRTLDSFCERLRAALDSARVADVDGAPAGLCTTRGGELYQLFVAASARGGGVAAGLLADGEMRMRHAGVENAWLACAIGNARAARFYEKHGWRNAGVMVNLSRGGMRPRPGRPQVVRRRLVAIEHERGHHAGEAGQQRNAVASAAW